MCVSTSLGGGGLVVETHVVGLQTLQRSDVPQPSAV